MTQRSRKQSSDKAARSGVLSEQHILDTALRMVRRSDARQLSMRALAKELGVTPMALYHHVPNKETLLERVRDSALAMVPNPTPRRRVAKRKSDSPLTLESIVAAALRVTRRGSVDTLTMRAVAEELGVSAMALYYYVPDKETLLDHMREVVTAQVPTPPPQARDWEAQMRAYALEGIRLLSAYPGLLRHGLTRPPTKANVNLTIYGMSILLAAGFDERSAALAITTYHTHIIGTLMMQPMFKRGGTARAGTRTRGRPAGIAGAAQHMRDLDFYESIEYGIDTVLSGLRARLAAARPKARQRPV